jgi:hypothetical protein
MIRLALAVLMIALSVPAQAHAEDDGLQLWKKIHRVFSHPRCANCHVGDDNLPMWSGASYGTTARPHGMNIDAGGDRLRDGAAYIPCTTCHSLQNSPMPHGPPGATVWRLAPVEMQWFGKSSAEICMQIKDHVRNGDRSLAGIADHIEKDDLVHWGWSPGPGREPAPFSPGNLVAFIKQWDKAGAPCPAQ